MLIICIQINVSLFNVPHVPFAMWFEWINELGTLMIFLLQVLHENLKVLDLSESDVSDEGLRHLCKCPQLQKIDLNSAKQSRVNISTQG